MNSENRIPLAIIIGSLFIAGSILGGAYLTTGNITSFKAAALQQEAGSQQPEQAPDPLSEYKRVADYKKVSKDDHIYGNPDAQITLIEYSDFECPFCKRFHPTAKQVVDAYVGKVNWVYRHFPLGFHDPLATKQAEATECVAELGGNDAFWKYTDKIYETTKSNGNGMQVSQLADLASEVGVNKSEFSKCFESGKYTEKVKKDIVDGGKAGVNGTPGNIVVNNETGDAFEMTGAQPFIKFKELIDEML